MSRSNLKLSLAFDFELKAPETMLQGDHEALCRALNDILGAMVLQGMPTITAKQLAKADIAVVAHHHRVEVANTAAAAIPREALIAAAPHLTDRELTELAHRLHGKLPLAGAEQARFVRRQALALVSDFRMVACEVTARLTSGQEAQLESKLNLTNGSVLVGERDRQRRLQANQGPLRVAFGDPAVSLPAQCAGHTLSGPVIEVGLADLAAHRDALIDLWQRA
jgi:hypothetical protein